MSIGSTQATSRPLPDLSVAELRAWMQSNGFNGVHAPRVVRSLLATKEPENRADFLWPEKLNARLMAAFAPESTAVVQRQVSADGTTKLLLRLHDQRSVESVLMHDYRGDRAAGCISSQAGCAMGCDFCATTQTGFERNLTSG